MKEPRTYYLALDLKDDAEAIAAYERHHREDRFWPEIADSIRAAGVRDMEIYRTGNRLFMVMTVSPSFSFEKKAALDAGNAKVREWESLMERFQQRLPWTPEDGKWERLERIFSLPPAKS